MNGAKMRNEFVIEMVVNGCQTVPGFKFGAVRTWAVVFGVPKTTIWTWLPAARNRSVIGGLA